MWHLSSTDISLSTEDEFRKKGKKIIFNVLKKEGSTILPMSLTISKTRSCSLPDLVWCNFNLLPKNVKIINSSQTVTVNPVWDKEEPYITGGSLSGKFVPAELHFHWGKTHYDGSAHVVEGNRYPLELHAVCYNSRYCNYQMASNSKNGLVVLVYFFQMVEEINEDFSPITNELKNVVTAYSAYDLSKPLPMANLLPKFTTNYFMYWGSVTTVSGPVDVPWLICRNSLHIASSQLMQLRTLKDERGNPILSNHGTTHDTERTIFHISVGILIGPMVSPMENQSLKDKEVVRYEDPTEETGEPEEMEEGGELDAREGLNDLKKGEEVEGGTGVSLNDPNKGFNISPREIPTELATFQEIPVGQLCFRYDNVAEKISEDSLCASDSLKMGSDEEILDPSEFELHKTSEMIQMYQEGVHDLVDPSEAMIETPGGNLESQGDQLELVKTTTTQTEGVDHKIISMAAGTTQMEEVEHKMRLMAVGTTQTEEMDNSVLSLASKVVGKVIASLGWIPKLVGRSRDVQQGDIGGHEEQMDSMLETSMLFDTSLINPEEKEEKQGGEVQPLVEEPAPKHVKDIDEAMKGKHISEDEKPTNEVSPCIEETEFQGAQKNAITEELMKKLKTAWVYGICSREKLKMFLTIGQEDEQTENICPFVNVESHGKYLVPINIDNALIKPLFLNTLEFFYILDDSRENAVILNTGSTLEIKLSTQAVWRMSGGPLSEEYGFHSLHFHWGKANCGGSQHMFDSESFSMEVHIIHLKTGCSMLSEASSDAIAVVSVLLQAGGEWNKDFDALCSYVTQVKQQNTHAAIPFTSLGWLQESLKCSHYYTYMNSFSTSTSKQDVLWIVYPTLITISDSQIETFHQLEGNMMDIGPGVPSTIQRPIYFTI